MKTAVARKPKQQLQVLLLEDNPSDAWLVQNSLDDACPGEFDVMHVLSMDDALMRLTSQKFDLALLDLSLPGCSGLEVLASVRCAAPQLPMIILTGHDDEAMALTAMQHGAQDYLVKDRADAPQIKRAITYAIKRNQCEEHLLRRANYDMLTGLANRSLFESRLELALARSKRSGDSVAVFFIDLDRFKQVNDTLGHEAGDALLKEAAKRLKQALREYDTAARLGGDEFAVLLEGVRQSRHCAVVAQKILAAIRLPFFIGRHEAHVGASIGIALSEPLMSAETLLQHADSAMYRSKEMSGNNHQFYAERLRQEENERQQLENELAQAISAGEELRLYYQPKIDMQTQQVIGAEALLRWQHPRRGLLAAADFLPLLQGTQMSVAVDAWVVESACRDMEKWREIGIKPVQVSVHVNSQQWQDARMMDTLLTVMRHKDIDVSQLALEIEESVILLDDEGRRDLLSRVRKSGIELHLDNFGSDIASLKALSACPLDALKIDRRLTEELDSNSRQVMLLKTLVGFGQQLGMKVVAEGVETRSQLSRLSDMRCDQVQGKIVSPPLPADEFCSWIRTMQPAA